MMKKKKEELVDNTETEQEINIVKEIVGMILYIVVAIFVVWIIVTFVGQRTQVSGSSMYDTLEDGDNLWIDKLSYRLHDPERFDIIVFPFQDSDVYYIKRIIGLPGETVRIEEDGKIYIGEQNEDFYQLEDSYAYYDSGQFRPAYEYDSITEQFIPVTQEWTLGEDEYFVMGDNRNDSKDSRYEDVGLIKRKSLKGKAVLRIWPFSKFGKVE